MISFLNTLMFAIRGIEKDQQFMLRLFGNSFTRRYPLRAWLTNPGIRAAFWMRVSSRGGLLGLLARQHLISRFACDVTTGAQICDGLYLPHPLGIVIGNGVKLVGNVSIYQGVTIGSNTAGEYPTIHDSVRLFPNSIIVGKATLFHNATVSAHSFVSKDVAASSSTRGTVK